MNVMTVRSVKMATANVLLSILFVSGAVAVCQNSALFITTPREIEALSGSCLQISCNFSRNTSAQQTFDNTRPAFGVWIKSTIDFANHQDNVIFNSSKMDSIYPMNLTGDLSQKICTSLFYSLNTTYTDRYYFRIENGPFRATAVCDPLHIKVNDSPPRPSIEISGDLKEKQSVTITCSAFTPCPHSPPELTWNLQQDAHNIIEKNTNQTFTTKIQTSIPLTDEHDGLNVTCSARYPVNEGKDVKTAEDRTTLSVSYAPKDTSATISPSGLVSAGSQVNLTCFSRANPPVSRFTWFKTSKDGPISVSEGDFYSFNVTDGGVYYCVATNELGNGTSPEIHLTIEGAEVSSLRWEPVVGGIVGTIAFICLVVCVWRLKSTYSTAQQTQSQTGGEAAAEEPSSKTEEGIHYGEIDFSKRRPEPSSASVQDAGQQQDTLYAQVKVSQTANSVRQTADGPEDLYAQVKRK